jgi:hypothetical protein
METTTHCFQVGSVVVSHVTGFTTTWVALLTLLALHLSLNYAAVRSVQMTSLNRQRANIALSALLDSDSQINLQHSTIAKEPDFDSPTELTVLTPAQVSSQERIFHRADALQWTSPTQGSTRYLGSAEIGISLDTFFKHARRYNDSTSPSTTRGGSGPSFKTTLPMEQLTSIFEHEPYILFLFPLSGGSTATWHASILLKKQCTVTGQLKAWAHALLTACALSKSHSASSKETHASARDSLYVSGVVADVLDVLNQGDRFKGYLGALERAGWDVGVGALETRGGRRVSLR